MKEAGMEDLGRMTAKPMTADLRFALGFSRLRQVFVYMTDQCNLRCSHCFYKPRLTTEPRELASDVLFGLLHLFAELGARKLSLLGGEPMLYGRSSGNAPLWNVVREAHRLGFTYVRVVTNGLAPAAAYRQLSLAGLDELTISLEGDTPELNDRLRGPGTFRSAVGAVTAAADLGLPVQVTMSVHTGNVGVDDSGKPLIERAIIWAAHNRVSLLNLHPLIKMGVERDAWTGPYHIEPAQWIRAYEAIDRARSDAYPIPVRMPIRFVTQDAYSADPARYQWCPLRIGERVEVHANGQIQSCALSNGTSRSVAHFVAGKERGQVQWARDENEKASVLRAGSGPGCRMMRAPLSGLVPVCISLKPGQTEFAHRSGGQD